MLRTSLALAVFPAAFGLAPVLAAEDRKSPLSLSLDEALRLGESASPLVRRALAETRETRARDVGARLALPSNPVFGGFAGRRREAGVGGTPAASGTQFGLHLEQAVEIGNQRGARIESVRRASDVALARETVARIETRARIKAAYTAAVIARKQVEASLLREELATQLLDAVRSRVEQGAASNIDLRLAELERGRAESQRVEDEQTAALALVPLRSLLAMAPGTSLSLSGDVPVPPPHLADLPALLNLARQHRAELLALDRGRLELDAELVRLSREAIPTPTFFVDYQRDLPGQHYLGGGVAVPLPTFRRNQGEKALVRASLGTLETQRELVDREIGLEVEAAQRAEALLRRRVDVSEKTILPAAQALVELLTEGWKAGKFDLFRVINASREASEARHVYLSTLAGLWQASIDLDRATGRL
jgi:cobalt-zinc-cadmium efflux system outer membrane protein